jgi:hypothetical protein
MLPRTVPVPPREARTTKVPNFSMSLIRSASSPPGNPPVPVRWSPGSTGHAHAPSVPGGRQASVGADVRAGVGIGFREARPPGAGPGKPRRIVIFMRGGACAIVPAV